LSAGELVLRQGHGMIETSAITRLDAAREHLLMNLRLTEASILRLSCAMEHRALRHKDRSARRSGLVGTQRRSSYGNAARPAPQQRDCGACRLTRTINLSVMARPL
jgi:hypothetical protein